MVEGGLVLHHQNIPPNTKCAVTSQVVPVQLRDISSSYAGLESEQCTSLTVSLPLDYLAIARSKPGIIAVMTCGTESTTNHLGSGTLGRPI